MKNVQSNVNVTVTSQNLKIQFLLKTSKQTKNPIGFLQPIIGYSKKKFSYKTILSAVHTNYHYNVSCCFRGLAASSKLDRCLEFMHGSVMLIFNSRTSGKAKFHCFSLLSKLLSNYKSKTFIQLRIVFLSPILFLCFYSAYKSQSKYSFLWRYFIPQKYIRKFKSWH